MKPFCKVLAITLSLSMLGPITPEAVSAAQASQKSLVSKVEIDAALRRASADEEASRDRIRRLLARGDVRGLAKDSGLDSIYLDRAAAVVGTLEGPELEQAATYAAELNDRLAGGVTITVSLVALLLIIIIIILLAK